MDNKNTALILSGAGAVLVAILGVGLFSGQGEPIELKEATAFSATDDQNIGAATRELFVLKKGFVEIEAQRYAGATTYEVQLRAKQVDIAAKNAEIGAAKNLPSNPTNDQALGSLTRQLYVLKGESAYIEALRYSDATTYEAQLRAKQSAIEIKQAQILAAQVK